MQLFSAEVCWYDEYKEDDAVDLVVGFAPTLAEFTRRVESSFSYIDNVTVHVINAVASEDELIYISQEGLKCIEEENDY